MITLTSGIPPIRGASSCNDGRRILMHRERLTALTGLVSSVTTLVC